VSSDVGGSAVDGPICPGCRLPLRETLRNEETAAIGTTESRQAPISITYCGSCGWTISATVAPRARVGGQSEVADPDDPSTVAGEFQLRCRELVRETIAAGFTPGGWIGLINRMGAVGAATHLLRTGHVLPVTRWLVQQGRPALTMEHEITQPRWAGLFTDDDRAEAARRLAG
jgi:hypothetical protein